MLLIRTLRTKDSEVLGENHIDSFNKTLWKTVDELGRERVEVRDPPIDGPFCPDHQVSPNDWWIPN